MMDGSLGEDGKTPMDYINPGVTRHAADMACRGVSVEGEIGCLGSLETDGREDGIGAAGS